MRDTLLVMKLMNGKAALNKNTLHTKGIGIHNVRQRLELLYKDNYDLQITEDDEVFVVDLKAKLIKIKNGEQADSTVTIEPSMVYN
jgi:LytS/YehU family sensor histidine kinase